MILLAMDIPPATWNFTMSGTGHPSRLPSQVITNHLMAILHEPAMPSLWKAGRITAWMAALMENGSQTFRSYLAKEWMTALPEG
ncbi:MAG TPA: hypothetical protein VKP04_01515 [Ktedonobacteraceae bacterium]|nr:hypothetical protein [Ktedonobacteraceae bacterium]